MRVWKLAAMVGGVVGAWLVLAAPRRRRRVADEDRLSTDLNRLGVDEASDQSFPASDPPARTVVTGARVRARTADPPAAPNRG